MQVADGLQFLHHEANLVHRGISPGVVMLTESGAWKLAGLGLAVRAQFAGSNEAATLTFDFSNPSPPSALQLTQVHSRMCLQALPWFLRRIHRFCIVCLLPSGSVHGQGHKNTLSEHYYVSIIVLPLYLLNTRVQVMPTKMQDLLVFSVTRTWRSISGPSSLCIRT